MMVDEVNAAGGLLGKKLEAVILDDETDVNTAVLGAPAPDRMDKVVAVLGPTTSATPWPSCKTWPRPRCPDLLFGGRKDRHPRQSWIFKIPVRRHAVPALEHARAGGIKSWPS
jgi:branched-chain amino acid transport system substrate-binding protein